MKNLSPLFPPLIKKLTFFLLLFWGNLVFSQTNKSSSNTQQFSLTGDAAKKTIQIRFYVPEQTDNLLVLIVDEKGNTVFLENKYRFKGEYVQSVDVKGAPGNNFEIQVKNDNQQIKRTFSML